MLTILSVDREMEQLKRSYGIGVYVKWWDHWVEFLGFVYDTFNFTKYTKLLSNVVPITNLTSNVKALSPY